MREMLIPQGHVNITGPPSPRVTASRGVGRTGWWNQRIGGHHIEFSGSGPVKHSPVRNAFHTDWNAVIRYVGFYRDGKGSALIKPGQLSAAVKSVV